MLWNSEQVCGLQRRRLSSIFDGLVVFLYIMCVCVCVFVFANACVGVYARAHVRSVFSKLFFPHLSQCMQYQQPIPLNKLHCQRDRAIVFRETNTVR